MFASFSPERENTLGARWNPPEVPAIYASLSRDGVLAEVEYQLSLEPLRPPVRRTLYEIEVALSSALDVSSPHVLSTLGLSLSDLATTDHAKCQVIGGAVEYLGHDGLLVPSARDSKATNLVIYPNRQTEDYVFRVVAREILFEPDPSSRRR
jgi:RES domain-containing protein